MDKVFIVGIVNFTGSLLLGFIATITWNARRSIRVGGGGGSDA